MKILLTMRTTGTRQDGYFRQTMQSLRGTPVTICRNDALTANANGLSQIDRLTDEDWIVMSEDDLEWCADPLGSIERWLTDYAVPAVSVYRFFAFDRLQKVHAHAATAPLIEQKGSQVVALRAADARLFAAWARKYPLNWRPKDAPFQDRPHDGFDKLIGYWAMQHRPETTHGVRYGLVSLPFFVRHLGIDSSLHRVGIHRDAQFAGVDWSYRQEATV